MGIFDSEKKKECFEVVFPFTFLDPQHLRQYVS